MPNYPSFVWNHTTTMDMILENQHVLPGRNWTNNYRRKEGLRKRSNLNRSYVHNIFCIIVINIWIPNSNTWNPLCHHSPHHVKSKILHVCGTLSFSKMVPRFRRSLLLPSWGYFKKSDCRIEGENYYLIRNS
jgi:hypothetical protein